MKRAWAGLAVVLALAAACMFQPDLTRFPTCDDQGGCPAGSTCLVPQGVCLPDCGERGPCTFPEPDGGDDAGTDGGDSADSGFDGGIDAGTDGGAPDAGTGLVLSANAPGNGVETVTFSHQFQASGGTPPYTFSAVDGTPPGLVLDAQGALSGRPTVAGSFPLTVQVTDRSAAPQQVRQGFTVHILPLLRVAGPGILADFQSGRPYAEQVSAIGGTPPYRFELVLGSALPSGIALQESGAVEGTSTGNGTIFEVRVTDSGSPPQVVTRPLQLTTSTCSSLLCLRTRSVPDARVGTAYAYQLQASSGTSPTLTWNVESGALPPGIHLEVATGALSGTPTQPGKYDFTVSVTDVIDRKSVALSLRVF